MPEVLEAQRSQEISSTENGETGSRTFWCLGYKIPHFALAAAPGLPVRGSSFPNNPLLTCVSREASLVSGHSDLVECVFGYVNKTFGVYDIVVERNTNGFQDPIWRDGLSVTDEGKVANDALTDIGGTHADFAGEPVSRLRIQTELQVTQKVIRNEFDSGENTTWIGKRNSTVYRGFPPGSLLYLGARSTGAFGDSLELVQHRFLYDEWRHLVQKPVLDASGNVILDGARTAKTVVWRQPYPVLISFSTITHPNPVPPQPR